MPASILTSLMLWSALLAPAASSDRLSSARGDREGFRTVAVDSLATIQSLPAQNPIGWSVPDADTEEEETGDGDSEGLVSDAAWLLLPPALQGPVSAIRRDRSVASRPARSQVLRC